MKRIAAAATLVFGLSAPVTVFTTGPAEGQPSESPVRTERILIDYIQPLNPTLNDYEADDPDYKDNYKKLEANYHAYLQIAERLKKRQLLEEFSQFLAPLRFPVTLRLRTQECGTSNAYYNREDASITLCYEYVKDIEEEAPEKTTTQGITREEAIVGRVVGTLLHEAGHAVSNLLRLPVFAREEDTADQIAGYVSLQFGREVARTLIKGQAYGWNLSSRRYLSAYWDVHSSARQRQQIFLCLAYGKDPEGFKDFIEFNWLPKERAENCAAEYKQVDNAFKKTILPHVDREMMAKVLARKWLRPDDGVIR
jgi:hypothetical protein